MRIGLIDVDGHNFPNMALMKISAYHKEKGDFVELHNAVCEYDKVYMSKIFDTSPDYEFCIRADEIEKGGRAYDKQKKLPPEIENMTPDYGLYNIKNEAYAQLTRGCPRACSFCDVCNIEGRKSMHTADIEQFYTGQKHIKLLDPNLLACEDAMSLLDSLNKTKAYIDFTQGLDIRLVTDEAIDKIKRLKLKMLHFAWDGEKDSDIIIRNLKHFKKATNINYRKLTVYVLVNFNTDLEFDLYRIYTLRELGYTPFVMVYEKELLPKNHTMRRLARWIDNKYILRTCERFEDYKD